MDDQALKNSLDAIGKWVEANVPDDQDQQALFKENHYALKALEKGEQASAETHLKNLESNVNAMKFGKGKKSKIKALLKVAKDASAAPKPPIPLPKSALAHTPQNTQMPFTKPGKPPGSLT